MTVEGDLAERRWRERAGRDWGGKVNEKKEKM
jgi:hypothetical protein